MIYLIVLYRDGVDPLQADAEWRELVIKNDHRQPPTYSVYLSSGAGPGAPVAKPAVLLSSKDLREIESEWDAALARLEGEGFAIYDPRTWRIN